MKRIKLLALFNICTLAFVFTKMSLVSECANKSTQAETIFSSSSPKPGKFCKKTDHGKNKSGFKCAKDPKGTQWRWR